MKYTVEPEIIQFSRGMYEYNKRTNFGLKDEAMTHSHNDDLNVEFSDDGKSATLTEDICFNVFGKHYTVPIGFRTDFASIPRVLRRAYPKLDKHIRAAVLHDWLYMTGTLNRDMSDRAFLDVMKQHGVAWWKRWSMYFGVATFGWIVYNRYRSAR